MLSRTVIFSATVATLFAADNPFVGTWKENRLKGADDSSFLVTENGQGQYHLDFGNIKFDVNKNGKPVPGPVGGTVTFKQVDSSTWLLTMDTKNNPKITYHLKDKNTLEIVSEETTASGGVIKSKGSCARTSETSGLVGAWKQQGSFQTTGPVSTLVIKGNSNDGLSMDLPTFKVNLKMTLDGKEYPVSGASFPEGMKASGKAHLVDSNTIVEDRMINGKEMNKAEYRLSPDKKTLTVTIHGPKEQEKTVYERQ